MKRTITLILTLAAFGLSIAGQISAPDLILFNGKIFTSDPANPKAEAIAVKGSLISHVGSGADLRKLASSKTRLIDLKGQTVIPSINDAHFHFSPHPKGVNLKFESMEPSWSETQEAIRKAARSAPKGQWIFATVGGDVMGNAGANRSALDAIAPDNPVVVGTYYGHGQIVNSKTLELLKIKDSEPDPMGGYFERDEQTKS